MKLLKSAWMAGSHHLLLSLCLVESWVSMWETLLGPDLSKGNVGSCLIFSFGVLSTFSGLWPSSRCWLMCSHKHLVFHPHNRPEATGSELPPSLSHSYYVKVPGWPDHRGFDLSYKWQVWHFLGGESESQGEVRVWRMWKWKNSWGSCNPLRWNIEQWRFGWS